MDTIWLADLQALAETLNFSRAAEKRNVTQPAFGRRIRSLEDWAGSALIDRSTHRLRLTAAGEIMLSAAEDIERRIERARNDIDQSRAATATLTFAATHALSFIFFPAWFQSLGSTVGTIPIRMLSDNMNECEKIMLDGRAQFLLCHYHPKSKIRLPEHDYKHVELATDEIIPVSGTATDGTPIHRLPGTPEAPVPALAFEEKSGMGRIIASTLSERTSELHLSTVFTSHLAMVLKALASDGKGVAWIPRSLAADQLGSGGG